MNIGKFPALARRCRISQLLPVVVLLLGVTCALFAQTGRGNIEGTVKDPNGANIPGAKVQVVNIETNSALDFSTNDLGYYLAPNLPVGSYRITVHKDGFRTTVREPILISSEGDLAVDFKLQIGAVNETVTVTGEAPLLDISATANPSNLTAKFIDDLPLLNFAEKGNITDNLRFLPGNTSSNGALTSGEPAESSSGRVNSAVQGSTEVFVDGAPSSEFGTRHWRNNLILGENSSPPIFSVNTNTNYSSSDYNGFRVNPEAPFLFQWNSPPWGTPADYTGLIRAGGGSAGNRSLETRQFRTVAEYSRATHQDQLSVAVDYDVFVHVPKLDAKDLKTVQSLYRAEDFDFRLKPGSAAVDRGVVLHNVTDGFTVAAPDLGALEIGQAQPHYGPR